MAMRFMISVTFALRSLALMFRYRSGSYELLGTEVANLKEKERTIDLFDGQIVSDVKNEL